MTEDAVDPLPPSLSGAENVLITGGNIVSAPYGTLRELKRASASDALHTSSAVSRQNLCTPGTRTVTLNYLQSLATSSDPTSPDVVWMHGPAGAGKSAIMRTLASSLAKDKLLLATFFFFRSERQRNTSPPFIPTLALQLWDAIPTSRTHISNTIHGNQNLFSRPPHLQSSPLLEDPLVAVFNAIGPQSRTTPTPPFIIIVDGLDECTDLDAQTEIIKAVVDLTSSIRSRTHRRIKVVIASRPEHRIKTAFSDLASNENIIVVRLDSSDTNIHLFYDEQFDKTRKKYGLPSSWPSQEDIKWLRYKTSGQYAFAGISTRFIHGGDPIRRLKIIQEALKDDVLRPFEALDQLYTVVFDQLPQDMRTPALLILRCRLRLKWDEDWNTILEPLFHLSRGYVRALSPHLSSLINFDDGLHSYHASLADFLIDPSRSGRSSLYIADRTLSHAIQRGILAVLAEGASEPLEYIDANETQRLSQLLENQDVRDGLMVPHPLPSDDLTVLRKRVHQPSLTGGLSMIFHRFLEILHIQFKSQHLYITNPMLWYAIWYGLPHQVRVEWERRTRSYRNVEQDADLAFGLLIAVRATPMFSWLDHSWGQLFQRLDEDFLLIDASRGWNLAARSAVEQWLNTRTLRYHLTTSSRRQFWRSVQAALSFASARSHRKDLRMHLLNLMHLQHLHRHDAHGKQVHLEPSLCKECADALSEMDRQILRGMVRVIREDKPPVLPKEVVEIYSTARRSPKCWGDRQLIHALADIALKSIDRPEYRYWPAFLSPTKWRIKGICGDLDIRTYDLIGKSAYEKESKKPKGSQLPGKHQELFILVSCSLIQLVWVFDIMY